MLEFNDRLANPLSDRELTRIIRSAYSGKYQAAHREKIVLLCQEWVDANLSEEQLFNKNGVGGNSRKKELFASIHIVMNGQKIYCPI